MSRPRLFTARVADCFCVRLIRLHAFSCNDERARLRILEPNVVNLFLSCSIVPPCCLLHIRTASLTNAVPKPLRRSCFRDQYCQQPISGAPMGGDPPQPITLAGASRRAPDQQRGLLLDGLRGKCEVRRLRSEPMWNTAPSGLGGVEVPETG